MSAGKADGQATAFFPSMPHISLLSSDSHEPQILILPAVITFLNNNKCALKL